MKKALSEANKSESESKAVKKTMKQGILNIQPFSINVVETSLKKRIPYAEVSDV